MKKEWVIRVVQSQKNIMSKEEKELLEKYALAVEERLSQLPDSNFGEIQCLKSWDNWKKENGLA